MKTASTMPLHPLLCPNVTKKTSCKPCIGFTHCMLGCTNSKQHIETTSCQFMGARRCGQGGIDRGQANAPFPPPVPPPPEDWRVWFLHSSICCNFGQHQNFLLPDALCGSKMHHWNQFWLLLGPGHHWENLLQSLRSPAGGVGDSLQQQ